MIRARSRSMVSFVLLALFCLAVFPCPGPAETQKNDGLARTGRVEAVACRHRLAQMIDEARYYDRMRADLAGMETQAAELQARLSDLIPRHRDAVQRLTALESEQKALSADLPRAEEECRQAWLPSLSGACSRRDRTARRLHEELPPELARLRGELPRLAQERQEAENTLSVLQMNLQSRRNYVARADRPADGQIEEQEARCRAMEESMARDPEAARSALEIAVSAPEALVGDEIALYARLTAPVAGAQYGFVWSLNGKVFGGNGDRVKTAIPGEGTNTVRVVAWRWAGGQWVKAAEASRAIAGRARVQPTVSIAGPSAMTIRDGAARGTFEARITPEVPGQTYGYTWGAVGDPQGPVTFSNPSGTQNLTVTTPGRYTVLVHAWKLVNGQWVLVGKAAHPFTVH
ncbi:MAG: hypothetical protein HPY67_14770 [Syntrophaceae bacterium]|nr:hypothetical protein [Syntrophaceae bacterium]